MAIEYTTGGLIEGSEETVIPKGELLIPLSDAKRKKERGQTNEEFLRETFEACKDFKQIVIVSQDDDGVITLFRSQTGSLDLIGTLEVAKQQVLDDMKI